MTNADRQIVVSHPRPKWWQMLLRYLNRVYTTPRDGWFDNNSPVPLNPKTYGSFQRASTPEPYRPSMTLIEELVLHPELVEEREIHAAKREEKIQRHKKDVEFLEKFNAVRVKNPPYPKEGEKKYKETSKDRLSRLGVVLDEMVSDLKKTNAESLFHCYKHYLCPTCGGHTDIGRGLNEKTCPHCRTLMAMEYKGHNRILNVVERSGKRIAVQQKHDL